MQVSVVHFSTNPVNTSNSMPNNGRSGRSTSKNNAANNTQFSNYAYGDKAYRLEDAKVAYVDRFRNFVVTVDSPIIPKWERAAELVVVNKYPISVERVLVKLHQIAGFSDWWENAQGNVEEGVVAKTASIYFDAVNGKEDIPKEAFMAFLEYQNTKLRKNPVNALYDNLAKNVIVNGVFLPITPDEEYVYADGTKSDSNFGHDGYIVVFDFNIKLSDELMAEIKK